LKAITPGFDLKQFALLLCLLLAVAFTLLNPSPEAFPGRFPDLSPLAGGLLDQWHEDGMVLKGSFVDADCVALPDGRYRLYYGVAPEIPGNHLEIFSSSSPDGWEWTRDPGVRMVWAAAPSVIAVPGGGWRMYYNGYQTGLGMGVLSAFSTDGLDFVREPGQRVSRGEEGEVDYLNCGAPSVIKLRNGGYRMYYRGSIRGAYTEDHPGFPSGVPETQFILSAVSDDGLEWTKEPGVRIDSRDPAMKGTVDGPNALLAPDGSTCLFYWSIEGTMMAVSPDGLNFAPGKLLMRSVGRGTPSDPSVVRGNDGSYWMYFAIQRVGIYRASGR